jgi:glutamate-1-semialdehyde aminotransferase
MPPTKDVNKIRDPANVPLQARLQINLIQRGIVTLGLNGQNIFVLSIAHTKEDIDQTIKAFGDSIDAMIADGSFDQYAKESKYGRLV